MQLISTIIEKSLNGLRVGWIHEKWKKKKSRVPNHFLSQIYLKLMSNSFPVLLDRWYDTGKKPGGSAQQFLTWPPASCKGDNKVPEKVRWAGTVVPAMQCMVPGDPCSVSPQTLPELLHGSLSSLAWALAPTVSTVSSSRPLPRMLQTLSVAGLGKRPAWIPGAPDDWLSPSLALSQ